MLVGTSRIDITPGYTTDLSGYGGREQPALGVRHQIFMRAAVFEANGNRLAVLSAEILEYPRPLVEEIRRRVATELDTPVEHVCFSVTHTHYAPAVIPMYGGGRVCERFQQEVMDHACRAAKEALRSLAPMRLKRGKATLDIASNRRNPGGTPCDDTVQVLAAFGSDDQPRLMMVLYACHPVCLSPADRRVSGDFCGVACSVLEAKHEGCTTLFLNGCAGDINPRKEYRFSPEGMERAGRRMADAVLGIEFENVRGEELAGKAARVELPYERLESGRIRRELDEIENLGELDDAWRAKRAWLQCMRTWSYPDSMPVAMQLLRLGELQWLTLSGEVLWGIRLQIVAERPDLWIAAYCNGGHGYISTGPAQEEGGYEPDSSNWYFQRPPLVRGTGEMLGEAAITFTAATGSSTNGA